MKRRTMVIRECHTKIARAHELKKGEGERLFKEAGEWMLRTIALIENRCRKLGKKPCIHIGPMMLTSKEIEALSLSDWFNELDGMIADVERGKSDSPE